MDAATHVVANVVCMYVIAKMVQMFATAPAGKPGNVVKGVAVLSIIGAFIALARLAWL